MELDCRAYLLSVLSLKGGTGGTSCWSLFASGFLQLSLPVECVVPGGREQAEQVAGACLPVFFSNRADLLSVLSLEGGTGGTSCWSLLSSGFLQLGLPVERIVPGGRNKLLELVRSSVFSN
jgi:hypothetical protein